MSAILLQFSKFRSDHARIILNSPHPCYSQNYSGIIGASLESMVRNFVVKLVSQSAQQDKEDVIEEIISDDDIQFCWSMISVDLDNHVVDQLLRQTVQLWVTIRGFSSAGVFLEHYKQVTERSTKKSTSLRKGLKQKKLDMPSDN